jgi:hypothetical protein
MSTQSIQTLMNTRSVVGCGGKEHHAEPTVADRAIVDSVFVKLRILFPVGAPKVESEGIHKSEWLKTLAVQGVRSREQVQYGLNRARREVGERKFWPTPRQFCSWCIPSANDAGLPELENAYREALKHYHRPEKHSWSHYLVHLAVRETGSWLFARGVEKDVFEVFSNNYTQLVRRYVAGEDFELKLPKALPKKVNVPTTPSNARKILAELRARYGLGGGADAANS